MIIDSDNTPTTYMTEFPYYLYNPSTNSYLFWSTDTMDGDNVIEARN